MPDFGIFRGFNDKLFGNKLYAGQLPTQLGTIGSINFTPFLLDLYPNAAAAYSVRKLRTLYTGSAIRVRRSSDNTEQDIGFTITGDLDTFSLTLFCGSGNGFVTTWYDQSGNARNATQTTAANQPQIVSSGSIILNLNKSTLQFNGNNLLNIGNNSTFNFLHNGTQSTIITLFNTSSTNLQAIISNEGGSQSSTGYGLWLNYVNSSSVANIVYNGSGSSFSVNNRSIANSILINTSYLINNFIDANNSTPADRSVLNINNNSDIKNNSSTGAVSTLNATNVLRIGSGVGNYSGKIQEIIIYNSSQYANNNNINNNINTYYGIY